MRRARFALLLLALLHSAVIGEAQGATLYVNRLVVAPAGDLSIGDLINASGDMPAEAREALARSVAVISDKPVYIPLSVYISQLDAVFGSNAIIVGSRSLVIPKGTPVEGEAYVLDRLIDFLQGQGLLGEAKAEIALAQNAVKGTPPQDGTPSFQVQKSAKGTVEVSFSLAGSGGGSVTGRAVLMSAAGGSDAGAGVKSGSPVQVLFRKGPITIEMPGKALASAQMGESVSVYVSESQMSFTGQVREGKAVEVDLP